jgi:hypothetical protein
MPTPTVSRTSGRSPAPLALLVACLFIWTHGGDAGFADAQQPGTVDTGTQTMYRVGGGHRDGPSAFPRVDYEQLRPLKDGELDFAHYHTFEESTALLRMWAERYPDIIDLYSVGHSLEGREVWQITITNKKTGPHTDKPAFFMEGGRHAGEISGIEATLYFINEVLTGYGKDPAITRLVDTKTIYARPNQNPDGSSLYHYTAQTLRSNVRPVDNDNDGLFDEDPGEDLDGDGFLRQMRQHVGAGKGTFVIDDRDPKGRAMRRVGPNKGDYEVYSEGIDNDGDGRYNEDGVGGLDLHRNYPMNWRPMAEATGRGYTQNGAGDYPLSEPETRLVFDFLIRHTNVAIAQSLDTAVPMILRPPSTSRSEESMFPEDRALYEKFDAAGLRFTNYPWAGDVYDVYATRGGPDPETGALPRPTPLFGHGPDFGYFYFGAIWYGNEIWNGGRFEDYNNDGRFEEWELYRWHDEHRPGKPDYMPWTAFRHPQLGDVEIGGFNPKFYLQNSPPDLLEEWAGNEARFNLYLAQQLPQVRIVSAEVTPAGNGEFDVALTVTNEGGIPTALEQAKRVKIVRPDTARVTLGEGMALVKIDETPGPPTADIELDWLTPGERKTARWRVTGKGHIDLAILSTRGGVDRRTALALQ